MKSSCSGCFVPAALSAIYTRFAAEISRLFPVGSLCGLSLWIGVFLVTGPKPSASAQHPANRHASPVPARQYSVEEGLSQSTVYAICQDHRGMIWLATGGGLQSFDGYRFRLFEPEGVMEENPGGRAVYDVAEIRPGRLVFTTARSLVELDAGQAVFTLRYDQPGAYPEIVSVAPGGSVAFRAAPGRWFRLSGDSVRPAGPEAAREGALRGPRNQVPHGMIAFAVQTGRGTDTVSPAVRTLFTDRAGNRWYGTDGAGLLLSTADPGPVRLAATGFTRCLAWYNGEVWAGTFRNGLWRLTPDLAVVGRFRPDLFNGERYMYDLAPDTAGRLWIATDREIIVAAADGVIHLRQPLITRSALFHRLPDGRLLLSSYDRLWECSEDARPEIRLVREQTYLRGIVSFGGAWWTSSRYGVYRTDSATGLPAALDFRPESKTTALPSFSLLPADDRLWIATERGLLAFRADGSAVNLPASLRELRHEILYSLAADSSGRIWFAGNRGAGCLVDSNRRVIRFGRESGLQSVEFNFNADLVAAGRVFFGGINGVNSFRSPDSGTPAGRPVARLASLVVSDTAWCPGIPGDSLTIRLSRHHPHVSGSFFDPSYSARGKTLFSYRLEGYQEDWTTAATDPAFSFRNLPPGNYRLLVRAGDPFQLSETVSCLLTIHIAPPFWKRGWFLAASAVLLLVSVYLLNRKIQSIRFRRLLREAEHRHAVDRERLRISRDMHDEIGSSLTQVAILSELAKQRSGDPAEVARLTARIGEISGQALDEMGEIIWTMNPKNDNLASFASYVRQHAVEYLDAAGIRAVVDFPDDPPPLTMNAEQRRHFYLLIKEALHNIVRHAGARTVQFRMQQEGNRLTVEISDDGRGFDPVTSPGGGNGLPGMRRRAETLKGELVVDSSPGKGVRILFSAPLDENHPNR